MIDATYSPDDNKLRLYAATRLDEETYQRVKAAGYRWAPKQDLFFCPRWTPTAEDLALELAGEIRDEDTSLVERAAERAERFEGYSANRERDGDAAQAAVAAIADNIPLGQPILVGHHSEKRARKDAERIENGMRKAIKAFETADYWKHRAAGAIRAAKYKQLPQVRARRIKKLEAERRKLVSEYTPDPKQEPIMQTAWLPGGGSAEEPTPHVWCRNGGSGRWVEEARLPAIEKHNARWIAHLDKRLVYERAMLKAEGASHLLEKPKRPKLPPLLNYRSAEPLQSENNYNAGRIISYPQVEVTKADLAKVPSDYKGTRRSLDGSHRFRIASGGFLKVPGYKYYDYVAVFLTDSKQHPRPL
jgi:hypothetical protein